MPSLRDFGHQRMYIFYYYFIPTGFCDVESDYIIIYNIYEIFYAG